MAILINGNGNQAIYAAQDADLIASICGGVTSIAQVGNEFAYDLLDANTIGVKDGVILTKEGRRIQLDIDNIDEFAIPNGQQGTTSYYIIGYKLVTDAESKQTAQTFVQLMENGTDTIPEDTFRGGADEVYVSLYRVTQDGLNIDTVDLLLPKLSNINGINADLDDVIASLTANSKPYSATYSGGKYGFTVDGVFYALGGGGVSPNFKQKIATLTLGENNNYTVQSGGGVLFGTPILSAAGSRSININGNPVAQATNGVGSDHICVEVQEGDVISCAIALETPNYIYAGLNVFEKL